MDNFGTKTACGGCGEKVGGVHKCPTCAVHMHPFCGTPVSEERFGQPVLCPHCSAFAVPTPDSSPPIVAAFARVSAAAVSPRLLNAPVSEVERVPSSTKRALQSVSTIAQRIKVVRWLAEQEAKGGWSKGLFARAVDEFPTIFNSSTRNANLNKAAAWWKGRERLQNAPRGSREVSARNGDGRKRASRKALAGRGRPRSAWVDWLYPELLDEFDRLRKAGLKFDAPLLRQLALRTIENGAGYDSKSVDDKGALIIDKITSRWIQTFMENHQIVLRAQTGKKQVSADKQRLIEQQVAVHLGELKRGFESGALNEDTVENIDETHFVIDYDNGRTLGFIGEKQIKYADVVSGGEGMTMVVRISGGASARILPPMMIFTNQDSNYPIRGVPDNIPGVCYRSGRKGWMDKHVFREFLREHRAMSSDRHSREKTIFLDNCSSHLSEDECESELRSLNARLKYFPPNATDLCQPADSFVIAKIKDVWSRKWNAKKIELIEGGEWQNAPRKDGTWSGKLRNPGKKFFLSLAAEAVREVNAMRDKNGMSYARKAMIRCGLSLGISGAWDVKQLFPHLQEIVRKYPDHFAGAAGALATGMVENVPPPVQETPMNKEKRRQYVIDLYCQIGMGKKVFYMDETNFNLWCARSYGWSKSGERAVENNTTGKGKNIHVIACVSEHGLEYSESRFGSFTAVECNAFVERLLRHIVQSHDLSEVVLVVDNAPCHTSVEDITCDDEFAAATILKLGPYSPMLNPIENVFSTYKSAVKRFLARNRAAIKQVPPRLTIVEHRSRFLQIAADLILPEVVTEELCRSCSRHTAPFHVMALDRLDMPVGE